jgi:hypothetical protein
MAPRSRPALTLFDRYAVSDGRDRSRIHLWSLEVKYFQLTAIHGPSPAGT